MTALLPSGASTPLVSEQARADELVARLDALAGSVRQLSLDCFDTILVRDVAEPTDVFYDLARSEPFARLGFSAKMRVDGETRARSLAALRHRRSEVSLAEIYRGSFPALSDDEVAELANAEVAAEKRACSAFEPTIELMRAAKARGLSIVVVSDTYLSEPQLRELIQASIPADAFAAIDRIFCSSEHGRSKAGGLLKHVVQLLGVAPRSVLHVGDHAVSDLASARAAGLQALQLVHHSPAVASACRTQGMAMSLMAPEVRRDRGLPRPYAALFSQASGLDDPAALLGYVGAGPVLYAFARFILSTVAELESAGARPKPLFMLRDAFLPQRVCSELLGHDAGPLASLSRFAAYAASFRSKEDVERYLARSAGSARFEPMVRQLLLPPHVAERVIKAAKRATSPTHEFVDRVLERSTLAVVLERSTAYRARLLRYLGQRMKLERGDTLVMIDLGYEGTVQRQLAPVLADELGVSVKGCYLLASRVPGWEQDRRGLFDPSNCDDRVLATLVEHIALLEDLCTSDDPSIVDYREDGEPVFDHKIIDAAQHARTKTIQGEIVRFAREAEARFTARGNRPDAETARLCALAALARLLYFPGEAEISYLEDFRLDMNLATTDAFQLFDRELGLDALRRKGAFFMQHGMKTLRTNCPIELRSAGIELSVALFAQRRYALSLGLDDVTLRRERVSLLLVGAKESGVTQAEAQATHDGYFTLVLPLGRGFRVGVLFGQLHHYVQIYSVELLPIEDLYASEGASTAVDVSQSVTVDGMRDAGGGLFECLTESAFLLIAPEEYPATTSGVACRLVYRPVVPRRAAEAAAE